MAEGIAEGYRQVGTYEHRQYDPPGRLKTVTSGRTVRCGRCGHILSEQAILLHEAMWCRTRLDDVEYP